MPVVAAAIAAARALHGADLPPGACLARIAEHFLDTWRAALAGKSTPARKIRDRDGGHCQVPGCSRPAAHAHHVLFRSHGGGDEGANLVALCASHHMPVPAEW